MKRDGFGLVEILISSSLLLFLIGGTAQLLMISLTAHKNADFCFAAARSASARLEYLKSLPFDSAELQPGTSALPISDGAGPGSLTASCTVEDIEPALKRVILRISDLNSPRRKQTYCLVLCRDLEF